eukprot:9164147-Alexandrium_andersonii.AAC.1
MTAVEVQEAEDRATRIGRRLQLREVPLAQLVRIRTGVRGPRLQPSEHRPSTSVRPTRLGAQLRVRGLCLHDAAAEVGRVQHQHPL